MILRKDGPGVYSTRDRDGSFSGSIRAIASRRWRDTRAQMGTKRPYWHVVIYACGADVELTRNLDRLSDVRQWLDVFAAHGQAKADAAYRADWDVKA